MTQKDYYTKRMNRHREAVAHHLKMAEQEGVHTPYHEKQAERHRQRLAELEAKQSKKDIGPASGIPAAGPASGII